MLSRIYDATKESKKLYRQSKLLVRQRLYHDRGRCSHCVGSEIGSKSGVGLAHERTQVCTMQAHTYSFIVSQMRLLRCQSATGGTTMIT